MSIEALIRADMKSAMKDKDMLSLNSLRGLISLFKSFAIDNQREANENEQYKIIEKAIKQHKEYISDIEKANSLDKDKQEEIIKIENIRIKVISKYLPKAPTEQEIFSTIKKYLNDNPNLTKKDMGKIMSELKSLLPARSDLSLVSGFLKQNLE